MGTFLVILAVLAFAALWYWQFQESKKALQTDVARSRHPVDATADIINNSFTGGAQTVLWTSASGPGHINMRRRGKADGITMSFTIEPDEAGGSEVSMWASEYAEKFLLVNFAGVVNRRKKAIAELVA